MNFNTPAAYCDVFDRLEAAKVSYVVVSGVAVVLHGHLRPIVDLDIVVNPATVEANRAVHTLALAGFVPTLPLPLSLVTMLRMFDQAGREIDVFVRYHIPYDELWTSSGEMRIGDSVARVASLEHLLRVKRLMGRPHDLMDLEGLRALEAKP